MQHKTCGSELARDDGVTFNINVGGAAAIASKLAPTGVVLDRIARGQLPQTGKYAVRLAQVLKKA